MHAMKSIPGSVIALLPVVWISSSHGAGMEIMGGTVQEFAAYQRSEFDKWTTFVKRTINARCWRSMN
jgi:hypothetical protein